MSRYESMHRVRVHGPCPCGAEDEARCDVCGGPACSKSMHGDGYSMFVMCCQCTEESAT